MSLNFWLKDIEDSQTVCWRDENNLNAVTEELIWNTIRIEMGEITLDTVDEFWARLQFMTKLHGSMWKLPDGDLVVTKEDVIAHIGLRTNVPTVHRARWLTRAKGQVMGPLDEEAASLAKVLSGDV